MATCSHSVLVVGAGPTGLILAIELCRRSVPIRLIDKRTGPSSTTRAMSIHARSMEMFDHQSIAPRLMQICDAGPGNLYHFPGMAEAECPRTDHRALPSRYNHYYKICQNDLEQALRRHLLALYGVSPEYATEVVQVSAQKTRVLTWISKAGRTQQASFPFVVGCDGVRSVVRKSAGISFEGCAIGAMAMIDVPSCAVTMTGQSPIDGSWSHYFYERDSFVLLTQMPGSLWRLYMAEATGQAVRQPDLRTAFQEAIDKIGIGIQLGQPVWQSVWEINNNIAGKYRSGRILLCGDASHVHSPAGGQGMNGAMQDAFNLGWKLAAVFHGHAEDGILDSYERERKPIGHQISEGAAQTHRIIMGFGIEVQDRLGPCRTPGWEHRTIMLVSGLGHNYVGNVDVPKCTKVNGPRAGERAPDVRLRASPQLHLYDFFRRPSFSMVLIGGALECSRIRDEVNEEYAAVMSVFWIGGQRTMHFDFDHQGMDGSGEMRRAYAMAPKEDRVIIVRPDLYIGHTCGLSEWRSVFVYMRQWCRTPRGEA